MTHSSSHAKTTGDPLSSSHTVVSNITISIRIATNITISIIISTVISTMIVGMAHRRSLRAKTAGEPPLFSHQDDRWAILLFARRRPVNHSSYHTKTTGEPLSLPRQDDR